MKKLRLARVAILHSASGTVMSESDGALLCEGKSTTFLGQNHDGSTFKISAKERQKRRSDAQRMTCLLRAERQKVTRKLQSITAAAQFAGISEVDYFHDLAAMGGRQAWLFHSPEPLPGTTPFVFAFYRDKRLVITANSICGAGFVLRPESDTAEFCADIQIIPESQI